MKSGACNDLGSENHGDEPVDGGAERRPPPSVGDVVAAFLPEVFETMAGVAKDEEPGRPGDAGGGQQDERGSDEICPARKAASLPTQPSSAEPRVCCQVRPSMYRPGEGVTTRWCTMRP